MWWMLLYPAAAGLMMYLLYLSGWMAVSVKRAVMFIGTRYRARFTSCSGKIRRVLRFRENRNLTFVLGGALKSGELYIEIQNRRKQPILRLDAANPEGQAMVAGRARYYLVANFRSATGNYEIEWY